MNFFPISKGLQCQMPEHWEAVSCTLTTLLLLSITDICLSLLRAPRLDPLLHTTPSIATYDIAYTVTIRVEAFEAANKQNFRYADYPIPYLLNLSTLSVGKLNYTRQVVGGCGSTAAVDISLLYQKVIAGQAQGRSTLWWSW